MRITMKSTPSYRVLGMLVFFSWILFALTLLPIVAEYIILWAFTFLITLLGITAGLLALYSLKYWKIVAVLAAGLLLSRYLVYWAGIAKNIHSWAPDMGFQGIAIEIVQSGWKLIENKISEGYPIYAFLTAYNEFVMPLLQALLLFFLIRDKFLEIPS